MGHILYDASNYTTRPLTPDILDQWVADGCGGVIIQAVDPPAGYPRSQTRDQVSRVLDYGLPVLYYLFWWAFAGLDVAKRHMDTLSGFEGKIAAGAIDVEDTTISVKKPSLLRRLTGRGSTLAIPREHIVKISRQPRPAQRIAGSIVAASPAALVDDIAMWVEFMRSFPTYTGMLGFYSGPWYRPYLGYTTWPADNGLFSWISQFDNNPDPSVITPCFGYNPPVDMKQFAGNVVVAGEGGIDASIATDDFMGRIALPVPQPIPAPDPAQRIQDLEGALGDVTGADGEIVTALTAAAKLTSANKMRGSVNAVVSRLGGIHKQFLEG